MPGVYGDHAKPGGWNERLLDEHFAQQRAEREAAERLQQYFEAGAGAEDLPSQRQDLGERILKWSGEVAPFIDTGDEDLPDDPEA